MDVPKPRVPSRLQRSLTLGFGRVAPLGLTRPFVLIQGYCMGFGCFKCQCKWGSFVPSLGLVGRAALGLGLAASLLRGEAAEGTWSADLRLLGAR